MENNYNPVHEPAENTPEKMQNPVPAAEAQPSQTPPKAESTVQAASEAAAETPPKAEPPRAPYGYNPYTGAPNPAPAGTTNVQNPPPGGQPYAAPQPPYGQPPYGAAPAQNPYTQNPGAYTQPPYSAPNQNPYYGQGQYYRPPQPPYGQPGAYGYYPPRHAYAVPQPDPLFSKKQEERRKVKSISIVHGLCVLGFSVLAVIISFFLVRIPGFYSAYTANTYFSNAFDAVYSLLLIGVPFAVGFLVLRRKKLVGDLPLGTPYDAKAAGLLVFIGLAVCLAGSYVTSFFSSIVETIFGIHFTMPEDTTVLNNVPVFLLYVLGMAVVPALVEEFAIRGVVLQSLRRYGDKFAIVMSSLVFALMHGNMVQIPFAFIAGLMIGYAVTVTGSMWTGVAIHFLNNLVSVLMQAALDNFSAAGQNITILALIGVIFLVGIVCAVVYYKTYARVPLAKGESVLESSDKNRAYIGTVPMIIAILLLVAETITYIEF